MLFECRGKTADGKPVLTEIEADDREDAAWQVCHSVVTAQDDDGPISVKWNLRTLRQIKPQVESAK